ncbi:MAG TPA: CU044_2847 family protein [Bryobacteraceae bacterium]|nr:CU044_2847 family protein [Bryobacteraceae bacterium]
MAQIHVEVLSRTAAGDLAPRHAAFELLNNRIDEIADSLSDIAAKLRDRLDQNLPPRPKPNWNLSEIELKCSLELEAETGVVIARASTTAGFEVSFTWKSSHAEEHP